MKVSRPHSTGAMPMLISAKAMKRIPAGDTSASVAFSSSARELGPAIDSPHSSAPSVSKRTEPSPGRRASNQRS